MRSFISLDGVAALDTLVQKYWLPTIRAAVALQRKDPGRAVELLKVANTIELSQYTNLAISLCPVYLRGEAYLMQHDGNRAAAEFQKFIDHWGLVSNSPWAGDTEKSIAQYREFLTLWKNADPDLSVLKEAKGEYKKLSQRSASASR
jgi:eukaryotic-like serine/threonine-protein kinase